MFRLETFGTLTLEGEMAPLPVSATQRRQLALLAIVASAGPGGISRDKVALLLWPESGTENARHSLSQLLYSIRQALGAAPIISRAGNLRLDTELMSSDIAEFDAALDSGDIQTASELYKGPFLDGFNPPSSPEFERWTDGERARHAEQLASSIERLARELAEKGDYISAAEWWKRLASLDPHNSRIAVSLMKALDMAGNRPGALQHARAHAALVREEIGVEPDPIVLEFADELQTTGGGRVYTPTSTPPYTVTPREQPSIPAGNPALENRASGRNRWNVFIGAVGLAAALALAMAVKSNRAEEVSRTAGTTIAVLPFVVHSDSAITYLGEGLVDLLSANLDGAGDLRAIDPHALLGYLGSNAHRTVDSEHGREIADHFQAAFFVLGDVAEAGTRIRISASLFPKGAASRAIANAVVEGERSELFQLVDQIAVKLLAGRYQGPVNRLALTAATTTTSLPALKHYLAGEREFRSGNYPAAVEAFEKAVELDTTFALAYYRMSVAAEWEGRPDLQSSGAQKALRFSGRLSDHDQQLVKALVARRSRDPDLAESLYRQIVREFPDDVEAWYQLGEVLFHDNAMRGRSFLESREAWTHVLELVPNDPDVLLHLLRVEARSGSRASLDSAFTRALPALTPDQRLETETFRAFMLGNAHAQDSMFQRLQSAKPEIVQQALWRISVYGRNIGGAQRLTRILVRSQQPAQIRSSGHASSMMLLLAEGRRRQAYAEGATITRSYPWSPDVGVINFQMLGFAARDTAAIRRLRARFDYWNPSPRSESEIRSNPFLVLGAQYKLYAAGLLSVELGETDKAREYARRLDNLDRMKSELDLPELFAVVVRASAARKDGNNAQALSMLENWKGGVPIELGSVFGVESYYGWLRAELLREVGRTDEAIHWYDSRADLFTNELCYLAPAAFRVAEIEEHSGHMTEAASRYRMFIKMWGNADQDLQSFVRQARSRLKEIEGSPIRQRRNLSIN